MLSFALKLVWFVLCIIGTVISWVVLVAFGSLLGSRWVPMSFCIALTVLEGMFCLGMIWRMDPFRMPRSFCVAQAILIHLSTYVLTGLSMAFCIATNFHILRPKTWANLEQSLRWRKVYIIPVIVYPSTISVVQIALNLHFDAIQPTDEMHCDASDPLWVRMVAHTLPAALLLGPTIYLIASSIRRVVRTLQHVERAQRDAHAPDPRQARRSEHKPPAAPFPPPPAAPAPVSAHPAPPPPRSFHLPFLRQLHGIAQTLAPPAPPSPSPSPGPWDDGRASVASSSFPTFASAVEKPAHYARARPEDDYVADGDSVADADADGEGDGDGELDGEGEGDVDVETDVHGAVRSPWAGLDADSTTVTTPSQEGHDALELDVKRPGADDADRAFRLSYREHAGTPSRISHLAHVPAFTPQIQRLLLYQIGFAILLVCNCLTSVIDAARARETPMALATHHFALLCVAWGPVVVFGTLPSVSAEVASWVAAQYRRVVRRR